MILGLLLFALATLCSPGAANLLAADAGARVGVRGSIRLIAGIGVTVLLVVALCAGGLGTFFLVVPQLRTALRALGSVYLLWLAWRIMRSGPHGGRSRGTDARFVTGFASTIVNPKTWTLAVGAAASFSGVADQPARSTAIIVSAFAVVVFPNLIAWAWLGGRIAKLLTTPVRWRVFSAVLAILIVVSVATLWIE